MSDQGESGPKPKLLGAISRLVVFEEMEEEEVTAVSAPPPTQQLAFRQSSMVRDRASLTLVSGPQAGSIWPLTTDETTVGRARECELRVDDGGMSRRHARISRRGTGTYVIEDLGSSNGTFVNASQVQIHDLADGDRIGLGPSVIFRFALTDEAEEGFFRKLYESSVLDGLTGAFNRKHFSERLLGELAYARRHATPLSLLMFDIDHFKKVNDELGHPAGDQVLRAVAALVKKTLRAEDIFARYGGEEFAVIARGIEVGKAFLLSERIRTAVEQGRIAFEARPILVTMSAGVASLACCAPDASSDELVQLADKRLYEAKHGGRNRSVGA